MSAKRYSRDILALALASLIILPSQVCAAAGDLDKTFGTDGKVITDFSGRTSVANALAIQSDGRIVEAGNVVVTDDLFDVDFALARYNMDGSLDSSFGTGGKVTTDFSGGNDYAFAVAIQSDGKIVAAGSTGTYLGFDDDFALVRYNSDGSLDSSFGDGGKVITDFSGRTDWAYALAIQSDGKIIAAGGAAFPGSDWALARYNTDGRLDITFGTNGRVITSLSVGHSGFDEDWASALAIQSDGKIVVAGGANLHFHFLEFNSGEGDFALVRYNGDGSLDSSFGTDGKVIGGDVGRALAIQSDGKIVVVGCNFAPARYNRDGTLDTSFGTDGKVTRDFSDGPRYARAVAIQSDGKIVAAGFTVTYPDFDFALARYNSDGTPDTSFGTDGKIITDLAGGGDAALALAIQPDGKIVAAGFANYDGLRPTGDFALARYESGTRSKPPNFVFIITDDQDTELLNHMPRVKRLLVDKGTSFTNMFVSTPQCCPSHVTILTGLYPHNSGVLNNWYDSGGGFQTFVDNGGDKSTIATWLQTAGYRTARFGKYLVEYNATTYIPPGWSEWYAYFGSGKYFDYTLNENGSLVNYGHAESNYSTDVLTGKVIDFIGRAEEDKPFFIFFAPAAPHGDGVPNGPATPAPRHKEMFAGARAPRPPSFNETDVSDKPPAISSLPVLTAAQITAIDSEYRTRLESLQSVDEAVESIVNSLAAHGKLDNTYLIFTSDNGYHLGQHRLRNGKTQVYEEDIRVPLVVRGPKVPVAATREHLAVNIDFAPTIAQLAHVVPGHTVDGQSFVDLFDDNPPSPEKWRRDFLVEVYRRNPPLGNGDAIRALRSLDGVLYAEYDSGPRELYDLTQDPYELESRHDVAPAGHLKKLSRRLAELAMGIRFDRSSVQVGASFNSTFSGTNLTDETYFDVRFRRPDSTTDEVALNWQQGRSAGHTVPIGTATGTWTVTGTRAHQDIDDHSGNFISLLATLTVTP